MRKLIVITLTAALMIVAAIPVMAATENALTYRKANGLVEFTPPKTFLDGMFMANEVNPRYIFGPVSDILKVCPGQTTWLIEDGELKRIGDLAKQTGPVEFTVSLEADCPGKKLTYYTFVVQHNLDPEQWLKWRQQFHKNKAEGQYGKVRDQLKKAVEGGIRMSGELRFLVIDGNLDTGNPEDKIMKELSFTPVYDLEKGQKTVK